MYAAWRAKWSICFLRGEKTIDFEDFWGYDFSKAEGMDINLDFGGLTQMQCTCTLPPKRRLSSSNHTATLLDKVDFSIKAVKTDFLGCQIPKDQQHHANALNDVSSKCWLAHISRSRRRLLSELSTPDQVGARDRKQ